MGNTVIVKQLEDFGWINPTQQLADEINEAMALLFRLRRFRDSEVIT